MPKKPKNLVRMPSKILPSYFGMKVVTAVEMARVEKLAVESGCSEEKFIEEAGKKVALSAMQWIEEHDLPKSVYLLVGKGNKGADSYAAGMALLEEGFRVQAIACFSHEACSEWNRKMGERFAKRKGQIIRFYDG